VAVLGPGAKWDVKIELKKSVVTGFDAISSEEHVFTSTDDFDDADLTAGDWYVIPVFNEQDGKLSVRFEATARSKVDVFGDSAHTVERECSASYYFVQKFEGQPSGGVPEPTPRDAGVSGAGADGGIGAPSGGTP
jgi:hypothetical protein